MASARWGKVEMSKGRPSHRAVSPTCWPDRVGTWPAGSGVLLYKIVLRSLVTAVPDIVELRIAEHGNAQSTSSGPALLPSTPAAHEGSRRAAAVRIGNSWTEGIGRQFSHVRIKED